jgi:hypothetical protein
MPRCEEEGNEGEEVMTEKLIKHPCVDYGNPTLTHHMCLHCEDKEACEEEYQNRIGEEAFIDHITGGNYS